MVGDRYKPRVLIVHNHYQIPGGEDTVVANEKRMLEKHGHRVILYTRNNLEIKELSKMQKLMLPFTTIFSRRTYKDIKQIIREQKIDIVHVHNTLNLVSPSVYYAAAACHVPVVQTIHNFRLLCPGATFYRDGHICEDCLEKGLLCAIKYGCYRESHLQTLVCVVNTQFHRMTGIYKKLNYICLTEFNKRKLLALKQISPERVFIKPNFVNGVNDEIIPPEKRVNQFVFVGRLDKLKGVDILLEAWKTIGNLAPKLIFCGTGLMENWCKGYIAEHGLDSVEMKGYVPNTEVKKLIGNSMALIFPSQWYEGFGMSVIEAFSVGTPVIVSDLGNAGELVFEGVTGCKFSPDSSESLVKALFRLGTYRNIYNGAKEEYKEKYTEENNYKSLIGIYQEVIEKNKLDIGMVKDEAIRDR